MLDPRPHSAVLPLGEIHLVSFELDVGAHAIDGFAACLAPDELARASRYHRERDRHRFVSSRAQLRHVLAEYTGMPPAALRFGHGPQGKPFLAHPSAPDGLRFNLSHSEDLALLGLVRGTEIGVDVESIHPLADSVAVARRCFSPAEFAQWNATPSTERERAFFTCWTRKEAYIKAMGGGFSIDLASFDVSIDPEAHEGLLRIGGSVEAARRWSMWSPSPAPGFQAAVAVLGKDLKLMPLRQLDDVAAQKPAKAGSSLRSAGLGTRRSRVRLRPCRCRACTSRAP